MNKRKMIYVSHAFGNNPKNAEKVAEILIRLHTRFPEYIFISPIHNYGIFYDKLSYLDGLKMCLDLLDRCDECWVFGTELSVGVDSEIAYCENHNIIYKIFGCFIEIPIRKVCHKNNCDIDCLQCEFEDEDDEGITCWLRTKKVKGEQIF